MTNWKWDIPQEATAMDILAAINDWAENVDVREGQRLWLIISAMRGPDSDNYDNKHKYTVPIRSAVLPNLADAGGADFDPHGTTTHKLIELSGLRNADHYFNHIRLAAKMILDGQREQKEVNA